MGGPERGDGVVLANAGRREVTSVPVAGEDAERWRERLLTWAGWMLAVGAGGIGAGFFLREGLSTPMMILHLALSLSGIVIALGRGRAFRARAYLWLGTLVVGQLGFALISGFVLGPTMMGVGLIITGGLFLSARVAIVAVVVSVLVFVVATGAHALGWFPSIYDPRDVDPRILSVSLRFTLAYAFSASVTALAVVYTVEQLTRNLQRAERSLEELRRAEAARIRAEEERRSAEQALAQSQKLEVVGQLASGVAHDFNNSLQVVTGSAELLRLPGLSEAEREQTLDEIEQACRQSARLVQSLLTLGRKEQGAPRLLALDQVVSSLAHPLKRLLPSDLRLVVETPEEAWIEADEFEVHQIVLNLVLNARDAMKEDGGVLQILVEARDEVVLLTVSDTGHGMNEAIRARIFEPFFTTKGPSQGTGLGLATVLRVVEGRRGRLRVQTEVGKGSTFCVELPRRTAPGHDGGSSTVLVTRPSRPLTVLVADDDERVRRVTAGSLERVGHTVLEAGSADQAYALARKHTGPIDVLCTDVVMPGMPVRELIGKLKAERPELVVLVCSGYVGEELLRRGIEARETPMLLKPFTRAELVERLDELTAR